MGVVSGRIARPAGISPTCVMTVVALLCHSTARPALPPVPPQASAPESAPTSAGTPTQSGALSAINWSLPPVRIGGTVNYSVRHDGQSTQSGLSTTLNASTNTYIWQPWFARVEGNLGFTVASDSSRGSEFESSGRNVAITGRGQVLVLAQSKFPFEAHFERNDSRASTDLAVGNDYASQRYGFTQNYYRPQGYAMFGWDRTSQTSADTGRDVQDSLQLRMTHRMEHHNLQFTGDRMTNKRELTVERAVQDNLSLQHSYTPIPSISVDSLANISRSDYRLQRGNNDSRLLQLSSNAFWRPEGQPLTVTGGVRMFTVETDSSGFVDTGNAVDNRLLNANANLGVSYEFNPFTRLNAGANVNMTDSRGIKTMSSSQTVGATYSPASIALGPFSYNWSTSASGSNSTGGDESERQLTLQFSHNLSRSFTLAGGSTVSVDASQGVAASASSRSAPSDGEPESSKQLNHSGSVSWSLPEYGNSLVRLSASDSRALDGNQEFFQLFNLQASSNLATSGYSSWNGNLTIQATRQGKNSPLVANNSSAKNDFKGFQTSSSGSISYQHQRLFGYRRLRFASDLRLNSDALLPLFGSDEAQELAAWANSLDYSIGRTQLRLNLLIARTSSPKSSADSLAGVENAKKESKINKSIMFTVSRTFGVF